MKPQITLLSWSLRAPLNHHTVSHPMTTLGRLNLSESIPVRAALERLFWSSDPVAFT